MPVISEKIKKEVRNVSRALDISEQEALERALLFYGSRIKKIADFKTELEEWDRVSDEALENLEKSLKNQRTRK